MLLAVPDCVPNIKSMKKLWVHEVLRVYYDRLVDDDDRTWLFGELHTIMEDILEENLDQLLDMYMGKETTVAGENEFRRLIFCDFAKEAKKYTEVGDLDELSKSCDTYLAEYNNLSKKPMNLVLFSFAVEHLARICRVIKQPRSHSLLVGVGGSGRQSLTRLSAFISEYDIYQVEISRQYGQNEWYDDLRLILKKTSTSDVPAVFLFADSQVRIIFVYI